MKPSPCNLGMDEIEILLGKYHNAMLVADINGKIRSCNHAFIVLTGFTRDEIMAMSFEHMISLDISMQEWIYSFYDRLGSIHELPVVQIIRKNEMSQITECSLHRMWCGDEEVFIFTFHNMNLCQGLSLLQRFSDSFMKDLNQGVILINTEFRLINISDMACRVLGFIRDEVINKPMDEVFASIPIDHQLVQRSLLNGHTVRNHAFSWTNDEVRYELLMDSNILKDHNGTIVGAYVIFKDVTNLRSLEEQVQRSDRLAMIGQIAAGTAHEIRNPLTSIKGFLQVLKGTFKNSGMEKEFGYTEIMLTEIDRINQLVSEFLLLSKPKNVSLEKINISTVLREILPIINNEAILHGVVVEYISNSPLPNVLGDRELFKQVCLNISKNGIEAMTDGGVLTIIEKVDNEELKVNIDIHDSGPGIPSFLIDKIFDPFFTTKENGTGLGLSVCQRIVHDLGGTIRVSSKGFGTTFTISIPFAENA